MLYLEEDGFKLLSVNTRPGKFKFLSYLFSAQFDVLINNSILFM